MTRVTFDPAKRAATLEGRGLDFALAEAVFFGVAYTRRDARRDYGEERLITVGMFRRRMVVVVWTPRGDARHVISMRKANVREQAHYKALLR